VVTVPKIIKIDHIGIAVKHLDQAVKLYQSVFRLPVGSTEINAAFAVKLCFIPVGEVQVEFLEPCDQTSPFAAFIEEKGEAIHHIAYQVDDLDAFLIELREQGVKLQSETPLPGGNGTRIVFIDPAETNHVLIELVEQPAS